MINFRAEPSFRDSVVIAAKGNGRSVSAEIEARLRASFTINESVKQIQAAFGGAETYAFLRIAALAIRSLEAGAIRRWYDDAFLHARVTELFSLMLAKTRPEGRADRPPGIWSDAAIPTNQLSRAVLMGVLSQVALEVDKAPMDGPGPDGKPMSYSDLLKIGPYLKQWLGPLLDKLYPRGGAQ